MTEKELYAEFKKYGNSEVLMNFRVLTNMFDSMYFHQMELEYSKQNHNENG